MQARTEHADRSSTDSVSPHLGSAVEKRTPAGAAAEQGDASGQRRLSSQGGTQLPVALGCGTQGLAERVQLFAIEGGERRTCLEWSCGESDFGPKALHAPARH